MGYFLENLYLKFYRNFPCITISKSTYKDLIKIGFNSKKIQIIPLGINIIPLNSLPIKEKYPTFLYVGRIVKSKRVDHILKAFILIKKKLPLSKMWIIGEFVDERYKTYLDKIIKKNDLYDSVTYFGFVSPEKKRELTMRAHIILVTSIREGWGLIVSEANALGTVPVVYDVPGLRDSIHHGKAGILCKKNNPENLAEEAINIYNNEIERESIARYALALSKRLTWENTISILMNFIHKTVTFSDIQEN